MNRNLYRILQTAIQFFNDNAARQNPARVIRWGNEVTRIIADHAAEIDAELEAVWNE